MTARGFATQAAARTPLGGHGRLRVAPLGPAIDALVRGIVRRSRHIVSPPWVGAVLPARSIAQRLVELHLRPGFETTLRIARAERPALTTAQRVDPEADHV
jgi:hypothetical protein